MPDSDIALAVWELSPFLCLNLCRLGTPPRHHHRAARKAKIVALSARI